jgi:hypothetical protein
VARKKTRAKLLDRVRWLTIKEIAEYWAEELEIPESIIQRELQLAVINLPLWRRGEDLIPEFPKSELPSADTIMDRADLEDFCEKQQSPWSRPRFWFSDWKAPSYPGRASVMHKIEQHFDRLVAADQLEETLAEQARVLAEWARSALPEATTRVQPPTAGAIGNAIRHKYRAAKAARAPSN